MVSGTQYCLSDTIFIFNIAKEHLQEHADERRLYVERGVDALSHLAQLFPGARFVWRVGLRSHLGNLRSTHSRPITVQIADWSSPPNSLLPEQLAAC